jgi:hypothetical protein
MKTPVSTEEEKGIVDFLSSRQLTNQYRKAKSNILAGYHTGVFLKERNPK